MSSRRIPLADNPNAVNSPYRANALKRSRALNLDNYHDDQEGSPPKKKQQLDSDHHVLRRPHFSAANSKAATEKPAICQESSLQARLITTRDARQHGQLVPDKKAGSSLNTNERERVRKWRRHYVTLFPNFVFYFESVPTDSSTRASKQIVALGAREEKFFSKNVTNVVTTRPVPSGPSNACSKDGDGGSSKPISSTATLAQTKNINPSPPEWTEEVQSISQSTKSKHPGGSLTQQRRPQDMWQDVDPRRHQSVNNNNTLSKARELGMRVWSWDKFERMMETIFNPEFFDEGDAHQSRPTRAMLAPSKVQKDKEKKEDLRQLLQKERQHGPAERAAPWEDIIPFRGIYIYVHDMDERVKPVMVREYAKPANLDDADWPQLHSASKGRCPFVEDPSLASKRELREFERAKAATAAPTAAAKDQYITEPAEPEEEQSAHRPNIRTRSAASCLEPRKEPPKTRSSTRSPKKPALSNAQDAINRPPRTQMPAPMAKPTQPAPKLQRNTSSNLETMPRMLGSTNANFRGIARNPGGEPLASGMRANVTSAIQSQMISSAAAAPGARVGTTKQMHQLNRRVLERQSGLSNNSVSSSVNANDVRAAINNERAKVPKRPTRKRPTEQMTRIDEDENPAEESESKLRTSTRERVVQEKRTVGRDMKPGYCENCREKYDDFHEHVHDKKHKRFALDPHNWTELDDLLQKLVRK